MVTENKESYKGKKMSLIYHLQMTIKMLKTTLQVSFLCNFKIKRGSYLASLVTFDHLLLHRAHFLVSLNVFLPHWVMNYSLISRSHWASGGLRVHLVGYPIRNLPTAEWGV